MEVVHLRTNKTINNNHITNQEGLTQQKESPHDLYLKCDLK